MDYHSGMRKKEVLRFVTPWVDLEGITLYEINQTELTSLNLLLSYFQKFCNLESGFHHCVCIFQFQLTMITVLGTTMY